MIINQYKNKNVTMNVIMNRYLKEPIYIANKINGTKCNNYGFDVCGFSKFYWSRMLFSPKY